MNMAAYILHMQAFLLILLGSILGILAIFLSILLINLATFKRMSAFQDAEPTGTPLLSLLVPARNEVSNIEACVRSLLAQRYPNIEVLVLDDQSSDGTYVLLQKLYAELPKEQQKRLRLLQGKPLPEGWVGKNYACHQLAEAARGSYLLFTDADTLHTSTMAHTLLNAMQHYQVQFLSALPDYIENSPGERLIIPLISFAVFTMLPVALIYQRSEPSLAMGNGQFLCFERGAYLKIDGHSVVRGKILEDVLLARCVKKAGLRAIFMDAGEQVSCRMYHSFDEIWRGFSKNLFALHNYSLPFALASSVFNLLLFLLPVLLLCAAPVLPFSRPVLFLAWAAYLLAVLLRLLLALRFTRQQRIQALLYCWLHPVSILLQVLILLNSICWHYRKKGTEWKGRYYR